MWDGNERRMSSGEEYGYLKATVEKNSKDIQEIKDMMTKHFEHEEAHIREVTAGLQRLRDDINVYKTVTRVVKLLGASAVLIMTLKFGDITNLWK